MSEGRSSVEMVLGALPEGVVLFDSDDRVGYANLAARALLGHVPDSLEAMDSPDLRRIVREAREAGGRVEVEVEQGHPIRTLAATATAFQGQDERVLLVLTDVTEQRRVEQMRRDFVADASHELKTPVASILAAAETLRMALGRDPDRADAFLDQVESSARHLARIVEDLLDLSRLEASERGMEEVPLDVVLEEEVERIRPRAEERAVSLMVETQPATVTGSSSDLGLAVRNLLDNAIRYTDPGGAVVARVRVEGLSAVVEVEDDGAGIPPRSLPRVFERFYRVDAARTRATGGTGLGLAIVKHVTERHGGRVGVESELGSGSVFRMVLPLGSAQDHPGPLGESDAEIAPRT